MRLLALAYFYTVKFAFQFLMQFEWFQRYIAWTFRWLGVALKMYAWFILLVIVGWLFWDILPLVALGFIAFFVWRWRRREAW